MQAEKKANVEEEKKQEKKEAAEKDEKKEEKKPSEESKEEEAREFVYRVSMHCEGCAKKLKKSLRGFQGLASKAKRNGFLLNR